MAQQYVCNNPDISTKSSLGLGAEVCQIHEEVMIYALSEVVPERLIPGNCPQSFLFPCVVKNGKTLPYFREAQTHIFL